ncbi:anti-sigma factor [Solwaraspora sp. WMMD1047]|uniref:anti-sigma factor n=1 Tax=Solwaraspora sp. WMMD1047 TaxID=3016102 RepID=UPI002417B11F|nr:anti-sigma factor [Solwaraspora sp. WMMD1047]MDG4829385.1 anti-sigma factor [Solwaraspora sp. WMMD1047]
MPHLDDDRLVFLALGEAAAEPAETHHLDSCAHCRAELASLRRVTELGAGTQPLRDLPPPPEHVWQGILAELATQPTAAAPTATQLPAPPPVADPSVSPPVDLAERRRRRWPGWARTAATAVAAAAIGVLGTLAVARPAVEEPSAPEVVASAPLAAYGDTPPAANGAARVFRDGRLHLHVSGLPQVPGYYEVWLINPATMEMFSVGVLGADPDALLPLPPNVDLAAYSVVDVSAEGYDNDTAHSGDSLLRGTLT